MLSKKSSDRRKLGQSSNKTGIYMCRSRDRNFIVEMSRPTFAFSLGLLTFTFAKGGMFWTEELRQLNKVFLSFQPRCCRSWALGCLPSVRSIYLGQRDATATLGRMLRRVPARPVDVRGVMTVQDSLPASTTTTSVHRWSQKAVGQSVCPMEERRLIAFSTNASGAKAQRLVNDFALLHSLSPYHNHPLSHHHRHHRNHHLLKWAMKRIKVL